MDEKLLVSINYMIIIVFICCCVRMEDPWCYNSSFLLFMCPWKLLLTEYSAVTNFKTDYP